MDGVTIDEEAKSLFWDYFNVADEIWDPGTKLDDLEEKFVARAQKAKELFGFSWPPYLPEAEEFLLDHRKELD